MRGWQTPVILAALVLAGCGGDGATSQVASEPPTAQQETPTTITDPAEEPTNLPTKPETTSSAPEPENLVVLRPDGLGPVDFGTPADETVGGLTELLGAPDLVSQILPPGPGDGGCVEGSTWVDCVRDLHLIERGQIVEWSRLGLVIALVDTDGRPPHGGPRPLQFGDWHATPATGDVTPLTSEGLHPGVSVGDIRRSVPETTFFYNEGVLDGVEISVAGGGYLGWLDWDPASAGNEWSELVRVVQAALNDHGADLVVDGEWGPRSQAAWLEFLTGQGIDPVPGTMWLTPDIGAALDLQPDHFVMTTLEPRPDSPAAQAIPSGLTLRSDGLGRFDIGDPAEELVAELVAAFGPPTDEVVYSAQPPDRLHMPGGYHALHDLAQYEWSDPAVLVLLSDTPFDGDHWDEPVPGTLHLIAWETNSGQLALDTGVAVGSTLAELRNAYRDVDVGGYDVCESDYHPAEFTARATFPLFGTLGWDWVTDLQIALNDHGATLDVDGTYGPATTAAVQQFQQANGIDADGRVNELTVEALALTAPDTAIITRLSAGYQGSC